MADGRASTVGTNQDAAGRGGSIGEVCRHGLVVLGIGDVGQTLLVADVELFGEEGAQLAPLQTVEVGHGEGGDGVSVVALEEGQGVPLLGRLMGIGVDVLQARPPVLGQKGLEHGEAPVALDVCGTRSAGVRPRAWAVALTPMDQSRSPTAGVCFSKTMHSKPACGFAVSTAVATVARCCKHCNVGRHRHTAYLAEALSKRKAGGACKSKPSKSGETGWRVSPRIGRPHVPEPTISTGSGCGLLAAIW